MHRVLEPCGPGQLPPVITFMSCVMGRVVAANDHELRATAERQGVIIPQRLTVFHGLRAPSICVGTYLERIFKYANCSPSCFVVAYAYIDRFIQEQQQQHRFAITSLNVHRLLITSVMVAAKFLDDAYYNNAYYAKVGGVTMQEMNRLELEFLFRLGFRLNITVSAFESYCCHLQREMMICGGYQIGKSALHYWCGLDENSVQDKAQRQQQQMTVWRSYAGDVSSKTVWMIEEFDSRIHGEIWSDGIQ